MAGLIWFKSEKYLALFSRANGITGQLNNALNLNQIMIRY